MIHTVTRTDADAALAGRPGATVRDAFDYSQVIVKKPWGYEYLVFENEHVALWILQIIRKRGTSMHCHARKSTGLVLLSGQAVFHRQGSDIALQPLDAVNIDPGAFHATEAVSDLPIQPVSENGAWVLELESPPDKSDLVRLHDAYGRERKGYEGASDMVAASRTSLHLQIPREYERACSARFQDLSLAIHRFPFHPGEVQPPPDALAAVIGFPPGSGPQPGQPALGRYLPLADVQQALGAAPAFVLVVSKEKRMMKVSDYIASSLAAHGVTQVFAVSGGAAMHLIDSFGSTPGLEYVAVHHEQAAAMAAEGHARISGKPGALLVTSGPGGLNTLTGVHGAWVDSIPLVVVSGQVTQDTLSHGTPLRQHGIQEADISTLVKPITKYAVTITDPATVRYHVEKALHLAVTGRPGPVWLDVPLDVQSRTLRIDEQPGYTPEAIPGACSVATLGALVDAAVRMLAAAARPVLYYGYGVRLACAEDRLRRLAARLGIPLISSWNASDLIPTDDPDYVGRCGIFGDRAGNFAVQNCDLLLAVGTRLSIPQTGYNARLFARGAKKIMVDIDAAEMNKPALTIDLPIAADAGAFLDLILERLGAGDSLAIAHLSIDPWRERCRDWKARYPVVLPDYAHEKSGINSFHFIDVLSRRLDGDAAVVTDMGTSFTCTMQTFRTKPGQRLFTSSGCASMGFGLPGAIGACFARGKRRTILIAGDGGLQMTIQELQTVVQQRLPLGIFVLNNQGYLTIKLMQQNHFGRLIGSDPSSGVSAPDFVRLAQAYGIAAERLASAAELEARIDPILAQDGPFLVEITMPPNQPLIPRVSSLKLPDGRVVAKPLEDLFPFLPRDEFAANMIVDPVEILNR